MCCWNQQGRCLLVSRACSSRASTQVANSCWRRSSLVLSDPRHYSGTASVRFRTSRPSFARCSTPSLTHGWSATEKRYAPQSRQTLANSKGRPACACAAQVSQLCAMLRLASEYDGGRRWQRWKRRGSGRQMGAPPRTRTRAARVSSEPRKSSSWYGGCLHVGGSQQCISCMQRKDVR